MKKIIMNPLCIYGFDSNGEYKEIRNKNIIIANGIISKYLSDKESSVFIEEEPCEILDASDKIITPSFVDPHTHLIYAGTREHEFFMRNRGKTYMEIAESGGGIAFTVKKTRQANDDELLSSLIKRLKRLASYGISHVEIKSGYGLTVKDELRLLKIINKVKEYTNMSITPTLMAAHDYPPEIKQNKAMHKKWIDEIIHEILPEVKSQNLSQFFDIFSEDKVFNLKDTETLLKAAKDNDFYIKVHADEITHIGASQLAMEYNAVSIEHLLKISEDEIKQLSKCSTIPVLLPGTAFYLNENYADFPLFEKYNVDVALATDSNPGSNKMENPYMIYTIAAIKMHMNEKQILKASTYTASQSLVNKEVGIIDEGYPANLNIINAPNLQYMYYHYGLNHTEQTLKNGEKIEFSY